MQRIRSALLFALILSVEQAASAFSTDANQAGYIYYGCGLPTKNVPRFALCYIKTTVHMEVEDADSHSMMNDVFEAIQTGDGRGVTITNYTVTSHDGEPPVEAPGSGDIYDYAWNIGNHFNCQCGLYNGQDDWVGSGTLATYVNLYLADTNSLPPLTAITEDHDGSSFSVTIVQSNFVDHPTVIWTWTMSRSYDGALLPTRNLRYGRDTGPCQPCCSDCEGHGVPVWGISQPYFNLWVHDTPVFYRTSLGQEIAFKIDFKQRDTRPKDDGVYPTAGWNHNWYSYVHFDIPRVPIVNTADTNTSIVRISARGVRIPHNWVLTNDYQNWEAILYAPDHSESYYTATNTTDPQNQRTLVPLNSSPLGGFRVVHEDGSQDIYGQVSLVQERTYGIVERFGCVFDKGGLTNGIAGVWQVPLWGGAAPMRQEWQDGDDTATYTSADVINHASKFQQLDYSDSPDYSANPAGLVEYVSYDAVLTARVDPYGNAITLSYNSSNRLSTITDYDGLTTGITYDTNGCVQSVAMPHGRTASFVYDADGKLEAVTDAQGMTSSMSYVSADGQLNYRLASLATPYGTTHFEYQDDAPYIVVHRPSYTKYDSGSGTNFVVVDTNTLPAYAGEHGVNRAIIVTHPDLSKELYFYCGLTNSSHVPASLAVSQAILDAAGAPQVDNGTNGGGGEASLLARNCFHWGRAQTPLLSIPMAAGITLTNLTNLTAHDFLLGTWQHYPLEVSATGSANLDLSPFPTLIREGSPDGSTPGNIRWFTYDEQGEPWQMYGEPLDWQETTAAPDGVPLVTRFTHDGASGLLTGMSQPYSQENGAVYFRDYTWGYLPVNIQEADGTQWSLPYLSSISTPFGSLQIRTAPEATNVGGFTVLRWPVVAVTDALGNTNSFFYNARHQLSGVKYANGLTVTNLYGTNHFLQKSIALEAQATNTYVFQVGELASRTTPLGLTLNLTHDLLGRLTSARFPDGTTISNVFDKLDLVAQKDRLGHWNYAAYDNLDQLVATTSRQGGTTVYSNCACGGLYSVTDPQGNTTTYLRDYLGRVTSILSGSGSVAIQRDNLGRPFHISSDWGLELQLAHNYQGLLTGVTNPAGTALSVVYDRHDLPEYVTDAQGVTVTYSFDDLRRLTGRYNDAFGWLEQRSYSAQGLAQRLDALNNATTYGYDAAGRLCAVTNANLEVTQLGYDVPHHRVSLTDGRNHTKWWAYDLYGRQVAETSANGVLVRTNGYDANSRLTAQWTTAKGLTQFAYDNNGNVLTSSSPSSTISYSYDSLDRLLTMSDAVGSHSFTYTNFGAFDWAPASESGPLGTVSHHYFGPNLASISIGSSVVQSITRDSALRPQTITSPAGTFAYGFNGAGRQLASLQMPGSTSYFEYTDIGELKSIGVTNAAHNTLDYREYEHHANGWIKAARRLGGITASYGYDNIGQLTSAQALEPNGSTLRLNESLGYGYDASGNLQCRTNNTLVQAFTSDAVNELASITRSGTLTVSGNFTGAVTTLGVNGKAAEIYSDSTFATTNGISLRDGNNLFVTAGSNAAGTLVLSTITSNRLPVTVSFAYDLNGNLLSDGQRFFEYDHANQPTAVTVSNSCRTEFAYDGLGRRRIARDYAWSSAIDNWQLTNQTRYVCDGYLPMQERDASGNVLVTYTRGLDLSGTFGGAGGIGGLLARTDGGGSTFYHADVGGNITSLTDAGGNVVARYLYDPFGRLIGKWGPLADANVMQFSSMPVHRQSGLSLYPFRAYDSGLQRWLNQDPIGEMGGINLYGFLGNDPINGIDPLGWSDENHPPNISITLCRSATPQPTYHPPVLSQGDPQDTRPGLSFSSAPSETFRRTMTIGSNPDVTGPAGMDELNATVIASFLPLKCPVRTVAKGAETAAKDATYLYQKVGAQGEHLKFGITKNPATRYTQEELAGGRLRIIAEGEREEMLGLERQLHETLPIGPEERQLFYIQKQVEKGLKPPPYNP